MRHEVESNFLEGLRAFAELASQTSRQLANGSDMSTQGAEALRGAQAYLNSLTPALIPPVVSNSVGLCHDVVVSRNGVRASLTLDGTCLIECDLDNASGMEMLTATARSLAKSLDAKFTTDVDDSPGSDLFDHDSLHHCVRQQGMHL